MMNLDVTIDELLALIGQLTVENRELRKIIANRDEVAKPQPKPAP